MRQCCNLVDMSHWHELLGMTGATLVLVCCQGLGLHGSTSLLGCDGLPLAQLLDLLKRFVSEGDGRPLLLNLLRPVASTLESRILPVTLGC